MSAWGIIARLSRCCRRCLQIVDLVYQLLATLAFGAFFTFVAIAILERFKRVELVEYLHEGGDTGRVSSTDSPQNEQSALEDGSVPVSRFASLFLPGARVAHATVLKSAAVRHARRPSAVAPFPMGTAIPVLDGRPGSDGGADNPRRRASVEGQSMASPTRRISIQQVVPLNVGPAPLSSGAAASPSSSGDAKPQAW